MSESSGTRSALGRDVVVSTAGLLVTRACTAAGGVLAARLLGPSLRGDYALVMLVLLVVGTAATLGFEYWVTAAIARGEDEAGVRAVARRQVVRSCAATVLAAGVALAAIDAARGYIPVVVVVAGAGFVITNVVSMLALAVLAGRRKLLRSSLAQVLGAASYAVMVAALLVTHRASLGYVVVAAAVSTLVLAFAATTRGPQRVGMRRDDDRAARRLGLPAMVGEVATLGVYRLDLAVVALLMTPADVGRYAVASSLAELLWIVPNGATQVLLPQVALDTRGRATAPLVLASTVLSLVVALGLSLAGPALVPFVFGHAYSAAVVALPWLCVGATALGAWRLLLADLAARGQTAVRGVTAAIAGVVMIALDFALIPVWGIGGAGMASLVAYVVAFAVVVRAWHVASERAVRELVDLGAAWALVSQSLRSLLPGAGARAQAVASASRP